MLLKVDYHNLTIFCLAVAFVLRAHNHPLGQHKVIITSGIKELPAHVTKEFVCVCVCVGVCGCVCVSALSGAGSIEPDIVR